jgi:hypothetical protein
MAQGAYPGVAAGDLPDVVAVATSGAQSAGGAPDTYAAALTSVEPAAGQAPASSSRSPQWSAR